MITIAELEAIRFLTYEGATLQARKNLESIEFRASEVLLMAAERLVQSRCYPKLYKCSIVEYDSENSTVRHLEKGILSKKKNTSA